MKHDYGEPLENPVHELFARNLASGMKPPDAYVLAGLQNPMNASGLAKKFYIRRRVKELLEPALRKHRISAETLLAEYASIAYANMADYYKENPETGEPEFDYGATTRAQRAAIAEITTEEFRNKTGQLVKSTKFKLHDKRGAMADLAKYLRLIGSDQVNVNVLNIENLKGADREALEQAVAELLERQKPGASTPPLLEGEFSEETGE